MCVVTVYFDQEGLSAVNLSPLDEIVNDLHNIRVLARLPVGAEFMTAESSDVSQRCRTVNKKYDLLSGVNLLL